MNENELKEAMDKYIERIIEKLLKKTFSNSQTGKKFRCVKIFNMNNLYYSVQKDILEDGSLSDKFSVNRVFLSKNRCFSSIIYSKKELEEAKKEYLRLNEDK